VSRSPLLGSVTWTHRQIWSDNGWHLGEKEHWHKSTLWQRSRRVPLIISTPGMIAERWRYIREARHDGLKKELARWMPTSNAAPKPERTAYDFDFATYTYKLKSQKP
jgi:hypothetical protein